MKATILHFQAMLPFNVLPSDSRPSLASLPSKLIQSIRPHDSNLPVQSILPLPTKPGHPSDQVKPAYPTKSSHHTKPRHPSHQVNLP